MPWASKESQSLTCALALNEDLAPQSPDPATYSNLLACYSDFGTGGPFALKPGQTDILSKPHALRRRRERCKASCSLFASVLLAASTLGVRLKGGWGYCIGALGLIQGRFRIHWGLYRGPGFSETPNSVGEHNIKSSAYPVSPRVSVVLLPSSRM